MAGSIDRVAIKLVLKKQIETQCYPTVNALVDIIVDAVAGEAQGSFGDVVLSAIEPQPEDVNKLWIRTDPQRQSFEQDIFIKGKWQPYYFVPPNTYILFDGRVPLPAGFTEVARFDTSKLGLTGGTLAGSIPPEIILAMFVGY